MSTRKQTLTLQLKRIAALQYNEFFNDEIRSLRNKYQIPKDINKAIEWIENYHTKETSESIKRITNDILKKHPSIKLPLTVQELIDQVEQLEGENTDTSDETLGWLSPKYYKRFPFEPIQIEEEEPDEYRSELDIDIDNLTNKFGLPLTMSFFIKRYLISDNQEWLSPDVIEHFTTLKILIYEGLPNITATVWGIYPWMTRKQWIDIWDNMVSSYLEQTMKDQQESSMWSVARKRHTLVSLKEQMRRDAEWYRMVELENIPLKSVLDRWLESHPDESDKYDESTVSKAVKSFKDIIKPMGDKT